MKKFKEKFVGDSYEKLVAIKNNRLHNLIEKYVLLCNPDKITVCTDRIEDAQYIRTRAIEGGEEHKLTLDGHTLHFDGYFDQARDKKNTKFLIAKDAEFDPGLNTVNRDEGLEEITEIMDDIMQGKELYIRFFCLGPVDSEFSIPAVQLTDSAYVAHSEGLLYRTGYKQFSNIKDSERFFFLIHSAGELEGGVSKNIHNRRVYIDLKENIVYSTNTQYGGNTIGLKKLSMRLAIQLASREGWLTEHMFVMGVHGSNNRVTYFTGAYPSMCGKTSTSMIPGETIIGDDIAYLRKMDGKINAVNVERGIFGIIGGINSKDDPLIWDILNKEGEIIFSNILSTDRAEPYWTGKDGEVHTHGINYSGEWNSGKIDDKKNEIPASHPNARFTVNMDLLENTDSRIDDPQGVEVGGIIYGGRDSHTTVPIIEAFDWAHGVFTMGASLESETTAATLGKSGVRKHNPMSNLDFLSIPLSRYLQNYIDFAKNLDNIPPIFAVNYFLNDAVGDPITDKLAKRVWLKWMELRVHGDIGAIKTPVGLIPRYEDLKPLFSEVLGQDLSEELYTEIFTLRVPENISKIERIKNIYQNKIPNTPKELINALDEQEKRLKKAKKQYGDYIPPQKFIE